MGKEKSFTEQKGRSWCFTMFSEEDVRKIRTMKDIRAIVIGREKCPTTGKEHYQGYIRFTEPKRGTWWKNQFPKVHVEYRRGSEQEAADYCRKEKDIIIDEGCQVDDPPMRTKREREESKDDVTRHVIDMLEDGAPLWQVYKRHRIFYFNHAKKIKDLQLDFQEWSGKPYKREEN